MKSKKLLIAVCLLSLTGCDVKFAISLNSTSNKLNTSTSILSSSSSSSNSSSSSSTSSSSSSSTEEVKKLDLEATLNQFKNGIKVAVELEETHLNKTTEYYIQNASKEKEFSTIIYKDNTRTEKEIHEYYTSLEGANNRVLVTRLDVSNQYNYYYLYNSSSGEYYTWEDGFNNAFLSLNVDSFTKLNNTSYKLNEDLFESKSDEFSTLFYGNPGLKLENLTISLEEEKLVLESKMKYEAASDYTYNVKAEVIEMGSNTLMDYRVLPFEEVDDNEFSVVYNHLHAGNYTAVVENYDDGILDNTSYYYLNSDKLYYETQSYKAGYYEVGDGTLQEVKKEGENFYKVGSPIEASLDELKPSLQFNRACFDKTADGVYTLKDGVEGSMSTFTVFESYAEELDEFTITIGENYEYFVFENVSGDYSTVVTFSNFGLTDTGFDADSVLEPMATTSWQDVVDEDSYQLLVDIAGEEAANIPVPENYDVWYQLSEEPEYVFFAAEASETIDDDIFAYYLALMDAGYIISEEEGMNGGVMGLKEIEVNGESHVLVVEFLEYEGLFCVLVYIGE